MREEAEKYKEADEEFKNNREAVSGYEDELTINLHSVRDQKKLPEIEKLYEEEIEWIRNHTSLSYSEVQSRRSNFEKKLEPYTDKTKEESTLPKEEETNLKVEEVD